MHKLLGNERAYRTLAAYLRGGRLPHAVLLEGARGSGRTHFAYQIAAGVLCTGEGNKPCGVCRHCKKAEKRIHPDISQYGGEGGARSFHIDTVRDIRREAFVQPNEAEAKVLLLLSVQDMSVQAQNALLKIIEEPPGGVFFILTCENKAALLETILSRVAVIELETPDPAQCAQALATLAPEQTDTQRQAAAVRAQGNIGTALEMLAAGENGGDYDMTVQILTSLCTGSELEAMALLSSYERDRSGFASLAATMRTLATTVLTGQAQNDALRSLQARIPRLQLIRIVAIMEEIEAAIQQNVNSLLLVTVLCAKVKAALYNRPT